MGPLATELVANSRQLAAMWVVFFITAGVIFQVPPLMFPDLMKEFGTTHYGISWLPATFQLMKGLFAVPGGFVVSHYGVANSIRFGTCAVIVASACYPMVHNFWILGALHGVYGFGFCLCGLQAVIVFATSWFQQDRALAIAVLAIAFSMAGVVFPPVVAPAIARYGWRAVACVSPVSMVAVAAPLVFGVLRDGPLLARHGHDLQASPHPCSFQTIGCSVDDGANLTGNVEVRSVDDGRPCHGPVPARPPCSADNVPMSFMNSLRFSAVWHLALLNGYVLYVVFSLINTLVLYLRTDAGISSELSGVYTFTIFVASVVGKLAIGVALDTRWQRLAGTGGLLLFAAGVCCSLDVRAEGLGLTSSHTQLFVFSVVYGLGYGASFAVITSTPAKMFGAMPEFSKLQGFLIMFQEAGGFVGILVTGRLREATGSYTVSFCIFILMASLSLVHYIALDSGTARKTMENPPS